MPQIDLAVFHDNGYIRKQCRVTNLWFWTSDHERETCGDTSEDEYTFIGSPLISGFSMRGKELKDAMREAFGDEGLKAFCKLNAFKYLWRSGKKGSEKEDIEKAIWYLRKSIGDDPRD